MQTPEPKNAVGKALKLLFLVAEMGHDEPARIGELAERAQLTRPTVHRHLNALLAFRLIEQTAERGCYRLGSGVLALGAHMRGNLSLKARALPFLRALCVQTRITVHLGVRDGMSVLYLEKIESEEPIRLASAVGQTAALHTAGLGKALLAFSGDDIINRYIAAGLAPVQPKTITTEKALRRELGRIRERGFAVDDEENEVGVRCVAAPVFGHEGSIVASVSIAGTVQQISRPAIATLGPKVARCTEEISHSLGFNAQYGG